MNGHVDRKKLDGWKEIAAHLNRSVRTARRWEKELLLPVRRAEVGSGKTVHAYADEIDDWAAAREVDPQNEPSSWRWLFVWPVAATSIALLLFAFYLAGLASRRIEQGRAPDPVDELARATISRDLT